MSSKAELSIQALHLQLITKKMASSPITTRAIHHARSASFPRTDSHVPQIDEVLCRINSNQAATSSSSGVYKNLSCLGDLYDCIDNLLVLSSTQQTLSQGCQRKQVDKVLDGLLSILDMCSTAKDVLTQTKENVQELFSILRRRPGDESELVMQSARFSASRKNAKKAISKVLKDSKSKITMSSSDHTSLVDILSEVQGVTSNVFQSMLHFIAVSVAHSKPTGWSLASKLMRSKQVESASAENEFATVDETLSLISHKSKKSSNMQIEGLQSKLGMLESCNQDLENELDCQTRRLIRIRVALLNILSY